MAAVANEETSCLLPARRHDDIGHDKNEDDTDGMMGMHTTSRNDQLRGTATARIETYAATAAAAISRSSTTVSSATTTEDDDADIEGDFYGGGIGSDRSCGGCTLTAPPPTRQEVVVDHQAVLSWPLALAVLVAVLTQMLVGYNIGVMNAPEPVSEVENAARGPFDVPQHAYRQPLLSFFLSRLFSPATEQRPGPGRWRRLPWVLHSGPAMPVPRPTKGDASRPFCRRPACSSWAGCCKVSLLRCGSLPWHAS
jgi:hypothetical protein